MKNKRKWFGKRFGRTTVILSIGSNIKGPVRKIDYNDNLPNPTNTKVVAKGNTYISFSKPRQGREDLLDDTLF